MFSGFWKGPSVKTKQKEENTRMRENRIRTERRNKEMGETFCSLVDVHGLMTQQSG